MFSRQRAILRLLKNEGGTASRLRLVKLAFLLSRRTSAPKTGVYEFLPYRRGPFSFTLHYDIRNLEGNGWVAEEEQNIKLARVADLETAFLDTRFLHVIDSMSDEYRSVSTPALIDEVYSSYPWFTVNSETPQKRGLPRPTAAPAVYTVGYEGIMVDGMLDLLLCSGLQRLIDVRHNPIARRYGFHKSTLTSLCANVGIEYVHVPSLGVPSSWRANLGDHASYQRLFERYAHEVLREQSASVAQVSKMIVENASALMCMEANHASCHRSRLAKAVSFLAELPVRELR